MPLIEEIVGNSGMIVGIVMQVIGLVVYGRLTDIVRLSVRITHPLPEPSSRKERMAVRLADSVTERVRVFRYYVAAHLLIDLITLTVAPWYIFVVPIALAWLLELHFLLDVRAHGYFHPQSV